MMWRLAVVCVVIVGCKKADPIAGTPRGVCHDPRFDGKRVVVDGTLAVGTVVSCTRGGDPDTCDIGLDEHLDAADVRLVVNKNKDDLGENQMAPIGTYGFRPDEFEARISDGDRVTNGAKVRVTGTLHNDRMGCYIDPETVAARRDP